MSSVPEPTPDEPDETSGSDPLADYDQRRLAHLTRCEASLITLMALSLRVDAGCGRYREWRELLLETLLERDRLEALTDDTYVASVRYWPTGKNWRDEE